jgi:hypothetical protein
MNDIKSRIYNHFFTRKSHFIINKQPLLITEGKEFFYLSAEYKDNQPWFKVDHGVSHIYFSEVDNIVDFIEKYRETK